MDPAITSALIAGPFTVITGALAYAAGRAQARGAHRGPVDAVRRQHQRDAYAAFHAAAEAYLDAADWDRLVAQMQDRFGNESYESLCNRALAAIPDDSQLLRAQSAVELEGPPRVAEAAGLVVAAARGIQRAAGDQVVGSYPTGRIEPFGATSAMRAACNQLREATKAYLNTAASHLNGDSGSA